MKELQARLASSVSALSQLGRGSLLMLDRPSEEHVLGQSARSPSRQGPHHSIGRSSSRHAQVNNGGKRGTPDRSRPTEQRSVPSYVKDWQEAAYQQRKPAGEDTNSPDFERELKKWRTPNGGQKKDPPQQSLTPAIVGSADRVAGHIPASRSTERSSAYSSGPTRGGPLPSFHAQNVSRQARQAGGKLYNGT